MRGSIVDRQRRQAGLHHRGQGADLPAGQDPQAARPRPRPRPASAGPGQAARGHRRRESPVRLNNKPDAATLLKKLSRQGLVRLPGPRRRPRDLRRDHRRSTPRWARSARTSASTPVGRWPRTSSAGSTGTATACSVSRIHCDAKLAGTDGSVTYDRGSDGVVIPGSYRNRHDAVDGSTVHAHPRRRHPVLRPAAGAAGPRPVGLARTCPPWCWTPRPARCWRWPTTTPSTRRQDIGSQDDREARQPARCHRRSSRVR